ncbi:hypothetical protein N2152v2_001435 [Parachlorella kessleri]
MWASWQNGSGHAEKAAPRIKLRRAVLEDSEQIAALCAEAFPYLGLKQQMAWGMLRAFFPPRSTHEWQQQFEKAVEGKALAVEAYQEMRAQGRVRKGSRQKSLLDEQLTPERQFLQRNYMRRGFFCLVAEDLESGALLGTLAASLARPQAMLPPPFPTYAPLRAYVSNVAVRQECRRLGVATALLRLSERLAAWWGHDSIWLHVEADNTAGVELYRGAGYQIVKQDPSWVPGSAYLMTKAIQPVVAPGLCLSWGGRGQQRHPAVAVLGEDGRSLGQTRGGDGVFVWDVPGREHK